MLFKYNELQNYDLCHKNEAICKLQYVRLLYII